MFPGLDHARAFLSDAWNLNRALVGPGIDDMLAVLARYLDVEVLSFPGGGEAFSWRIPPGWTLRHGEIRTPSGRLVASSEEHGLCVWTSSAPVRQRIDRETLFARHLSWRPDLPDAIPYRYAYYGNSWGFSVSQTMLERFQDDAYDVLIDAELSGDHPLRVGRYVLPGSSPKTIMIACHIDHPFQLADGLSGAGGCLALIEALRRRPRLYTYVFLFFPETIGSLAYFARHRHEWDTVGGLFLDMLCHDGPLVLQHSLLGDTVLDRAARAAAADVAEPVEYTTFRHYPGNDEMVMNGPGVGIPSLLLMRWPFARYHTSLDDFAHFDEAAFARGLHFADRLLDRTEEMVAAINRYEGLLSLSRHGLWEQFGGSSARRAFELVTAALEGRVAYTDIPAITGVPAAEVDAIVAALTERELVARYPG